MAGIKRFEDVTRETQATTRPDLGGKLTGRDISIATDTRNIQQANQLLRNRNRELDVLQKQLKKQDDAILTTETATAFVMEASKISSDTIENARINKDYSNVVTDFSNQSTELQNRLLSSLPKNADNETRDKVSLSLKSINARSLVNMQKEQSNLRLSINETRLKDSIKAQSYMARISGDPVLGQALADSFMRGAVEGGFAQKTIDSLRSVVKEEIVKGSILGLIQKDPARAVDVLNGGSLDPWFTPSEITTLRNSAESESKNVDRVGENSQINIRADALAQIKQNGFTTEVVDFSVITDPQQRKIKEDNFDRKANSALLYFKSFRLLEKRPMNEHNAFLEQISSSVTKKEDIATVKELRIKSQNIKAIGKKDSYSYVASINPMISQLIDEGDPNKVQELLTLVTAQQQSLGLPISVLSKEQTKELVDQFNQTKASQPGGLGDASENIAQMNDFIDDYGKYTDLAIDQLKDGGLSTPVLIAFNYAAEDDQLANDIIVGSKLTKEDEKVQGITSELSKQFDTALVRPTLSAFVTSNISKDSKSIANASSFVKALRSLAKVYYIKDKTLTPENAVALAERDMITDAYEPVTVEGSEAISMFVPNIDSSGQKQAKDVIGRQIEQDALSPSFWKDQKVDPFQGASLEDTIQILAAKAVPVGIGDGINYYWTVPVVDPNTDEVTQNAVLSKGFAVLNRFEDVFTQSRLDSVSRLGLFDSSLVRTREANDSVSFTVDLLLGKLLKQIDVSETVKKQIQDIKAGVLDEFALVKDKTKIALPGRSK